MASLLKRPRHSQPGATPLPEKYLHGMPVEVELLLADQFDEVYSAKVELPPRIIESEELLLI